MFRTVPPAHHQEFFTSHTAMVYVIHVSRQLSTNLYDLYHCCVYSEKLLMMVQRNCPKHVEFYSKNKFEKLMYLTGKTVLPCSQRAAHCLYSQPEEIIRRPTSFHSIALIIFPSTLTSAKGTFHLDFPNKTLNVFLFNATRASCPILPFSFS